MATTETMLQAETANGKSGSANPNTRKRAAGGKRAHKDGAERLRQAADKRVGRNSEQLADLLETKALAGNLDSLKVLVMLAERKKPRPVPVKKPRRPSLALRLGAEPEWEENREQGVGSRE
jgi:hypothetical protein